MQTPKDLKIIPRDIEFDIPNGLKKNRYWIENDPVKSHFFNALQSAFPEGERFFIDSARDVKDMLGDKISDELNSQLKLFIRQEAIHGAHHEGWNQSLIELGYTKISEFTAFLKKDRINQRKEVSPMFRLAVTAAGEHFTASMARIQLHTDPGWIEKADRPFRDIILYHAIEEIEHKAVCFDLFKAAGGGYFTRILGAASISMGLMLIIRSMHIYLLKKDGLWNKEAKKQARQLIWGRKGLVIKLLPDMLDYLRPGFHPWEKDDREWLLKDYNESLDEYGIDPPALAFG